jgi:hypothetical protein
VDATDAQMKMQAELARISAQRAQSALCSFARHGRALTGESPGTPGHSESWTMMCTKEVKNSEKMKKSNKKFNLPINFWRR